MVTRTLTYLPSIVPTPFGMADEYPTEIATEIIRLFRLTLLQSLQSDIRPQNNMEVLYLIGMVKSMLF